MVLRKFVSSLVLLLVMNGMVSAQPTSEVISSPNGAIEAQFYTYHSPDSAFSQEALVYTVSFKGKQVLGPSPLKLVVEGREAPLGDQVDIHNVNKQQGQTQSYELVTGRSSSVHEQYNSLSIALESIDQPSFDFSVRVRAYNEGIAFRYVIPDQAGMDSLKLVDEHSEFRFSDDATAYAQLLPHYQSMYESEYLPLPITGLGNQGGVAPANDVLVGLPLLLELPGTAWVNIVDADLEGYSATYLRPTGGWTGYQLRTDLSPQLENREVAVTGKLPLQTSWKAIMIADEPGRFIESDMVTSLNQPSRIDHPSWIKAGKSTWDWWSGSLAADGEPAYTTKNMKRYVDFADQSGFRYMLIDAGWSDDDLTQPIEGRVDVPEVVDYAADRDVKIWVWAHYDEVRNQREEAFSTFEEWGVVGVKIDFIERDDQKGIAFYYNTAEAAAEHHLMLDFHGSTKPTGIQRTWPNVLGYEAVVGMEQSKAGRRDNPGHHVMLPFTRMITGLMDYTPGGFDNVTWADFTARMSNPEVMGTRAHHLAMYVIYESPFQMVSDHPSAYRNEPAFNFIKNVPTTWDQTEVLNGEPGKYITMARRLGEKWYLGAMTNEQERTIEIPLSFLKDQSYKAIIYRDTPQSSTQPKQITIEQKKVSEEIKLQIELASAGGVAIEIIPD